MKKRIICLALAMLMVMGMFAAIGAAEGEPEAVPVSETTGAPAEPAADPAPADETTPEPEAAPIAEEPADDPVAPVSEPPAEPSTAPTEEPTGTPVPTWPPTAPVTYVMLHCNGGTFQGYSEFAFDVVDNTLVDGLGWYAPTREGYRFTGWYAKEKGTDNLTGPAYKSRDHIDSSVTDLYAGWQRVVVLDATPGNFGTSEVREDNNYTRTVDLDAGDTLPHDLPEPLFDFTKTKDQQTVVFTGWFTAPTTVTEVTVEDGSYKTWNIETHGTLVQAGQPVTVNTLYAGYKLKNEPEQSAGVKEITFYLHANGMGGSTGALQVTRRYDEGLQGAQFTAEDAAVYGINLNSSHTEEIPGATDQEKWQSLKKIWESEPVGDYTFLGWFKEDGTPIDGSETTPTVKNGEHLYAHWSKDGTAHTDVVKPEAVGPLEAVRINGSLSRSEHAMVGKSVTLEAVCFPIGTAVDSITWKITYSKSGTIQELLSHANTRTGEAKANAPLTDEEYGFTATVSGANLIITRTNNNELNLVVSATAVGGGNSFDTPASATVGFNHSWKEQAEGKQEATCTQGAKITYECECGKTKTVTTMALGHVFDFSVIKEATCTTDGVYGKVCLRPGCDVTYAGYLQELNGGKPVTTYHDEVIPATGHDYMKVSVAKVVDGVPVINEECKTCHEEDTVKGGDVTGDNEVSMMDVTKMFKFVNKRTSDDIDHVAGDVTGDNEVSMMDVTKLFKFVNERIDSLE